MPNPWTQADIDKAAEQRIAQALGDEFIRYDAKWAKKPLRLTVSNDTPWPRSAVVTVSALSALGLWALAWAIVVTVFLYRL